MSEDSTMEIYQKETKHGAMKEYVRVSIGTSVIEMPRRYRNPLTERTHDITTLSDDSYLKPFLALHYTTNRDDVIDLGSSPALTFDRDKWDVEECEESVVVCKREAESTFGKLLQGEGVDE